VSRRLSLLVVVVLAASGATASPAAAQAPFGHPCSAQNGVRLCPTTTLDQRVPAFDGVPLDVDVTLPPTGEGPWPTIVILHGYGGNKTNGQGTTSSGDNNVFWAQRGYAVVNPSARGFGRSCGSVASRTAGCERGWIRLADTRYEARDVQELLGRLVDEGVADPGALGVTGGSYGGGQSLELAYLRDRIRLPDGSFAPWRSPAGRPLRIAAAHPVIPWSDLSDALVPNGHFRDRGREGLREARSPFGVPLLSYVNALYAGGAGLGFVAPPGADPEADLSNWRARSEEGEPIDAEAQAILDEFFAHHQAWGLPGRPAPLLIRNGWTDDLFPVQHALRIYNAERSRDQDAPVALQFADLGHSRGTNRASERAAFNAQAAAFFDHWLKGEGTPSVPGSVTAFLQTCPKTGPGAPPYAARSWRQLHPGRVRFGGGPAQTFTSGGGNPATAAAFDPVGGTSDACKTVPAEVAPGTATYNRAVNEPFTLLGLPTVRARIRTTGEYGQIVSRLWDVLPDGTQRLVTRGVYRLKADQRGHVTFQLLGNGYRFEPGHAVKLELTGSDHPHWRRSDTSFSVRVSGLRVELPTAER
jgi:predicted acyl esterase